ncbi:DNA polymerase III subunits gamma and tau [Geminocystis sp. NIES-3708]|uniref:DNA polymerase III subunit gamma/tau n=1 Tax=Geminocystis sp. NIES-3708 TaxID=1615909 RepID=UPI0005FCC403|nr:DNA polymerase III subunit gamma/tau [Geminocystis sp. NIES-3708]BAQ62409.1 DNA polymerase III subunits gamma and tau [Geminocystis sp. NIES-3708]
MIYEPLHHKYRPQTFAQLAGQEAIAQTLINAINSEKIVPAYLFCGPRGTGKTSSARILAKSLNCLESDRPTAQPCGVCEACRSITNGSALDVIEIDAASNTGVDNIREIIEKAQFAPVQCRYKVYVIDECHMLSTAAFNALLKTLEEPPLRVIFVLATTDPQRVLPTIISRCQRFDYRRIPLEAMVNHLQDIAIKENIAITTEALTLIAQLSNGGMRDAQSLLDQLSLLSDTITPQKVWDLVGAVSEQDLLELIQAIATDNPETVITQCRKLLDRGREPLTVLQNLANFYLNLLIAKTAPERNDLVAITAEIWSKLIKEAPNWQLSTILQGSKKLKDSEVQIKNTTQPRLWLEITLLSLLPSANENTVTMMSNQITTSSAVVKNQTMTRSSDNVAPPTPSIPKTETIETIPENIEKVDLTSFIDVKEKVANSINLMTTKSFFRQNCHISSIEGNAIKISVGSKFLLEVGNKNKKEIENSFQKVFGQPMTVFFFEDKNLKSNKEESKENISETKLNESVSENPFVNNNQNNPPINNVIPLKQPKNKPPVSSAEITPSIQQNKNLTAKNAAENLAKSLNGEIVLIETKTIESKISDVKIVNRPQVEDFDDDDIPF